MHEEFKPRADAPRQPSKAGEVLRQPRIRLRAVIAFAVAAGLIAWAIIGNGDNNSSPAAGQSTTPQSLPRVKGLGPVALSPSAISKLSNTWKEPIYWAGLKHRYTYEVTRTSSGKVFVRYLPAGVRVGAKGGNYLIVATYPFPNAFNGLKAVSHGRAIAIQGNGIALVDQTYPKSVHVAFSGINYQVEVYDPNPPRARKVATSGDIQPVP
jgi:hypothetical protein